MKLEIAHGSLLDSEAQYIAHQCNCVTTRGAHLSRDIFSRYPYADIYSCRTKTDWRNSEDKPGTITVKGNGVDQRYVINMFGQIFPGKPKFPDSKIDGYEARRINFRKCLIAILKIQNLNSIAFPWKIGCGLAGGDWDIYYKMIEGFSSYVSGKVIICKFE